MIEYLEVPLVRSTKLAGFNQNQGRLVCLTRLSPAITFNPSTHFPTFPRSHPFSFRSFMIIAIELLSRVHFPRVSLILVEPRQSEITGASPHLLDYLDPRHSG